LSISEQLGKGKFGAGRAAVGSITAIISQHNQHFDLLVSQTVNTP
jgi:hypothetical protein